MIVGRYEDHKKMMIECEAETPHFFRSNPATVLGVDL